MHHTSVARTPVTLTRYFDEVVDALAHGGVEVAQVVLELSPSRPKCGEVITERGPVLRWREDLGWSNGIRSASPAAHPGEVAELLDHM